MQKQNSQSIELRLSAASSSESIFQNYGKGKAIRGRVGFATITYYRKKNNFFMVRLLLIFYIPKSY